MKTGVPHTVLRRAFPSVRQLAIRQAASISHVNAPGLHRSLAPEGEMLGRAALAAEAKKPAPAPKPSGIASRNQSLAKTLFPSSSPNRSLDSWANSGSGSASTSAFSRAPAPAAKPDTTQPLRNRNNNTAYQPARPVDGKKFASIVSASNSFNDSPDTVDHAANRASTMSRPVFEIFDGDLSDDNDLDFEAPCSLPNLPRPVPSAAPQEPPPGTNNTAISWATSSPTHLAPARPSLKRGSTGNAGLERQPEPKKRQLPWKPSGRVDEDEVEELYEVAARPPPAKTKGPSMWDQPADDIKAQKKQLKSQQKEAAASKPEATAEDMREAVKISTSKAKVNAIALSSEQEHIKKLVVEKGQSVFFTGPAGTGKSVLMRAIIAEFKKKFVREPERLAVTASTGLAACNIGGMTLHSFAGIGLGKEDVPTLVKKIRRNPKAKGRWQKTKVLVVDEISMVDGQLFDKLSQIGRTIRNNGRPWGGIQLVITGDFFQLPPVPDHQNGGNERNVKFAFDASTWNLSIDHTIGLTQVFRQRDQGKLFDLPGGAVPMLIL
ncbi:PIF1-like helicase-domain-containing protein [Podospora conica]|nr:PIF1-like helicase-domain-containing protein [Schizothecium conicum]